MNGYSKISEQYVDIIDSKVIVYKHNKTNARICVMPNKDSNKVFSIAFRTPAINSTGLTHILEHSVLCGSDKYRVKEPFVELLKSSVNTFINAFTFPDKTMYPCASLNNKDFKNLMSIYLDAVFFPRIHECKEIFMQEGWHYHIMDKSEPISINGVVYNEMKGEYSDPETILDRHVYEALFPNTTYGFESGGDPKYIPTLSYEEFKEFHRKFYHPSNSFIYLYGDCDMEERLSWLDKEYLSKFDSIDFDTTVKRESEFDKPVSLTRYYQCDDADIENKAYFSYNVVLPSTLDSKLVNAMNVILRVILQNVGAPIKERLIKEGISYSVETGFTTDLLQPVINIVCEGCNPKNESRFKEIIDEELEAVIKNGIDKDAIDSLLSFMEFKARENKFGRMPKGINIIIDSLATCLYDDNDLTSRLDLLPIIEELREEMKTSYYEDIVKKYLLNNNHKAYVTLLPSTDSKDLEQEELKIKLKEYKESLSDSELEELILMNKRLEEYKMTPSTKEELDTMPKLQLEDLDVNVERFNLSVEKGEYETVKSEYHLNDITYMKYVFDMSGTSYEDLKYLSLATMILRKVNTTKHSYLELHKLFQRYTGGITFGVGTLPRDGSVFPSLIIGFSALNKNLSKASALCEEVLYSSIYDTRRVKEIILENATSYENNIMQSGHVYANVRAFSHIDYGNKINDETAGIAFLDFLKELASDIDNRVDSIVENIKRVLSNTLVKKRFIMQVTTDKDEMTYKGIADDFYHTLSDNYHYEEITFTPVACSEGIVCQSDVNYVANCGFTANKQNGTMLLLNNILSTDYLWNNIRVVGGAYGAFLKTSDPNIFGCLSYRDPNSVTTLECYKNIVPYVKTLDLSDEELLAYKIGTIGTLQNVVHDSIKGFMAFTDYLEGKTYESKTKKLHEMLDSTVEDLKKLSGEVKASVDMNNIVIIGNKESIDECRDLLTSVRKLVK